MVAPNASKTDLALVSNTVVTTVMSNFGLYKAFDKAGINYAKTAVGDKYVHEYMSEHGCRLGGEQSGHIIFSKYATTGDGILTSMKIVVSKAYVKPLFLYELAKPLYMGRTRVFVYIETVGVGVYNVSGWTKILFRL